MAQDRTPVKTVAGVPIYLDGERFTASFGRVTMTRSRLREVEAAIEAWASQRPTPALEIAERVPTSRHYSGAITLGFSRITVTGHRDGRFRRGDRARDVIHGKLFADDPELRSKLEDIATRCQEAIQGYQREWDAARGRAVELTPEHLAESRDGTR